MNYQHFSAVISVAYRFEQLLRCCVRLHLTWDGNVLSNCKVDVEDGMVCTVNTVSPAVHRLSWYLPQLWTRGYECSVGVFGIEAS